MANLYVRSTDGSDADNGTTWALAKATLAGAAAIDAAGDFIYLSQNHSESSASTQTITLAGTAANPVKVLAANDAAEPPTTTATATVTTTGASSINLAGCGYYRGITFNVGTSTSAAHMVVGSSTNSFNVLETCAIKIENSGGTARIKIGNGINGSNYNAKFYNVDVKFAATTQGWDFDQSSCEWVGGSILAGGSAITTLIKAINDPCILLIKNIDLSNAASSLTLIASGIANPSVVTFVNCKLPASWSGGVLAGAPTNNKFRASMYNCDSGATNYRMWIEAYSGSIKQETTLVRTGGATDGTTPISWKMVTNSSANEHVAPLCSDEISIWNETTGASKTLTIEILHDNATALTDAEIWVELTYPGSSATPLGSLVSDQRATILTTAANQTTSSVAWTTTGLTNPNKQKLEVTFTPQMKGFLTARVCLAKPSYTVYVDALSTVS